MCFNPCKKLTMSVHALQCAEDGTVTYAGIPIAYAFASLEGAHKNYAQIKKELFVILFGYTKFHQWSFEHQIFVKTNHRPLVSLFNNPLHPKLQSNMLRSQCYDFNVVYKSYF